MIPVWFLVFAMLLNLTHGHINMAPGLPTTRIHIPGDVHIGALISVRGSEGDPWNGRCQDDYNLEMIEQTQFLIERIDEINADPTLLNGTKLGITIYDFCVRDMFALAQLHRLLPDENDTAIPYVGVFCCQTSAVTVLVSSLSTAYEMPQISHNANTDALSNKAVHEFFLRTLPPSRLQADTLMKLVVHFNWTYLAVLYTEGIYGDSLMTRFNDLSKLQTAQVCIGYSAKIALSNPEQVMAKVVDQLLNVTEINVVMLFLNIPQAVALFRELKQRNVAKKYVWIGGDGLLENINSIPSDVRPVAAGIMSIVELTPPMPEKYKFLADPQPSPDPRNPWLPIYFEKRFNCGSNASCNITALPLEQRMPLGTSGPATQDSLMVLVNGLKSYLPTIGYLTANFSTSDYLQVLRNLNFTGQRWPIQFDNNGDVPGIYTILQGVRTGNDYTTIPIATADNYKGTFDVIEDNIRWYGELRLAPPGSVCSKPCGFGYIRIQRELICCWQCHRCRDNELPDTNSSTCVECPDLTWPDSSRSRCERISPQFLIYGSDLGVALLSMASIGAMLTLVTSIIFIKHNDHPLLQSSCREMSYMALLGIATNYSTLILLVSQPADAVCYTFRFGMHLANSTIYVPALLKIVKIFRIFRARKRSERTPAFMSPLGQFVVFVTLVVVEGIVVLVSVFLEPPVVRTFTVTKTEPVVEMTCNESVVSMGMGLAFNFALLFASGILAFAARRSPENQNESSQIAFSMLTTIILWAVFLPAWITSPSTSRRAMMLGIAITLNGFVNLVGLFFRKVYAFYFVVAGPKHPYTSRNATQSTQASSFTNASSRTGISAQ